MPSDWETYSDPDGHYSLRYPPTWFAHYDPNPVKLNALYSWDPAQWNEPGQPPASVHVILPNPFVEDGTTPCSSHPEDATPTTLGGVTAWRTIRIPEANVRGITRSETVLAINNGYCIAILVDFTQDSPEVVTFEQILGSLKFTR